MSLAIGTATIADDGTLSGSGLAYAIVAAFDAGSMASIVDGDASHVAIRRGFAAFAHELAAAIVPYVVANAAVSVTIGTGDSGLQRVSGTPTDAPAAPKTLGGVVA